MERNLGDLQEVISDAPQQPNFHDPQTCDFVHTPLCHATEQIRLVWIHETKPLGTELKHLHTPSSEKMLSPGNSDTPITTLSSPRSKIQCALATFNLDQVNRYFALSYTWGNGPAIHEISINGALFLVRKNLWDFLVVAQMKYPNIPFWIDQICIDQENSDEKNHQVRL